MILGCEIAVHIGVMFGDGWKGAVVSRKKVVESGALGEQSALNSESSCQFLQVAG